MISSALSSDSDDVTKLLNVSLDLIAPGNSPPGTAAKTPTPLKAAGSNTAAFTSMAGIPGGGLKGGDAILDSERAVEVLSFLVSKTKVGRVLRWLPG